MERSRLLGAFVAALLVAPLMAQAQNRPPVADAGPDQYIFTDGIALLSGSATDADNDPIEAWQWTMEAAPTGSNPQIFNPTNPSTNMTADTVGTYNISLLAGDGLAWSDPDYVNVFVADLLPPEAVATADVTSGVGPLTVQFDASETIGGMLFDGTSTFGITGTGWDNGFNDTSLYFDWNFGDSTIASGVVSPTHTYTAPGTYQAVLTAIDTFGQSDLAVIQINVSAVPVPPAVWLFGSGLIGLIGIARRRGKAA